MSRTVLLDAGPLGLITNSARSLQVRAIRGWADALLAAGHRLIVPAIADYEVRRELERSEKRAGLARLDAFNSAEPDLYLPLSDTALRLTATLWARARRQGMPTADPRALDCDVILAAQAMTIEVPSADLVIATTNVGHLERFVAALGWESIRP
ncbi:MAG: nuclease [Anaerolineales bacterium]